MPLVTTRVQKGIYANEWIDNVTIEEVLNATPKLIQLAEEDQVNKFVVILDTSKAKRLPIDLANLRRSIPEGVHEIVICGIPTLGTLILRMFKPMSTVPLSVFETYDEAIAHAKTIMETVNAT
ncbi:MAG: hypothetical protein AAFV93_03720 [Chloroflexota bacterium]